MRQVVGGHTSVRERVTSSPKPSLILTSGGKTTRPRWSLAPARAAAERGFVGSQR